MNNLTKRLAFSFGLLSCLSLSSLVKSQDFLPGKFKGYQSRLKDTLEINNDFSFFGFPAKYIAYDLDKDKNLDVIEIFPQYKTENIDSVSGNPICYVLNFNNNDEPVVIFDFFKDGLDKKDWIAPQTKQLNQQRRNEPLNF